MRNTISRGRCGYGNLPCRARFIPKLGFLRCGLVLLMASAGASAWATQVRIASFNVKLGIEGVTNPSYAATRAILQRVDADVVGFQEVTTSTLTDFRQLAAELGYSYVTNSTTSRLDSGNTLAVMSRYPIFHVREVTSPPGAEELFRKPLAFTVDVPGTTNDPTMLVVHHKCCDDTNSFKDRFIRAVESKRVREFMQASQFNANSNVFVLGDFNFVGGGTNLTSFDSFPTSITNTNNHPRYVPGDDVSYPVVYSPDPDFYYKSLGLGKVAMRQADGVTASTFNTSGEVFDFIVTSAAVASRGYQTEIYNSAKDNALFPGLPKAGNALAPTTSTTASDHFLIFGDFEMDGSTLPGLVLQASPGTIVEAGAADSLTLTVRISRTPGPGESVIVNLDNSAPGELSLPVGSVTFTEGVTAIDVLASPVQDHVVDGDKVVTITATADGYAGATCRIMVADSDYGGAVLISGTGSYAQNFNSLPMAGTTSVWNDQITLPGWYAQRTGTNNTIAAGEGGSSTGGLYSFGTAGSAERALGSVGSGNVSYAYGVQFRNTSSRMVTINSISFTGEQWRVGQSVTNRQTVDFFYRIATTEITNLSPGTNHTGWTQMPALAFASLTNSSSATNAAYGKIDGNLPENRTVLSNSPGLAIEPGEFLLLRWSDIDHGSYDHGLAIDDLVVSWSVAPDAPDTAPPVISLSGSNPLILPVGAVYADPGATAFDAVDGSVAVHTNGVVDTSVRGTNTVSYTATDAAGNTASATRTVVVRSRAAHLFETQHALAGLAAAMTADADYDGAPNLVEYALGSDPTDPAAGPAASIADVSNGQLRITAVVRADDSELVVQAVKTRDLQASWSTNGVSEVFNVDQSGVGEGFRRRIWQVDAPDPSTHFMRVELHYP